MSPEYRTILKTVLQNDHTLVEWELTCVKSLVAGEAPVAIIPTAQVPTETGPAVTIKVAAKAIGCGRTKLHQMLKDKEVQRSFLGRIPLSEIQRLRSVHIPNKSNTTHQPRKPRPNPGQKSQ